MSGLLQWMGVAAACGLAAMALVGPAARSRARSMLGALAILVPLLLAELWNREELRALRDEPIRLAALVVATALAIGILVPLMRRRPEALPLAVVAVLPFRVPLGVGGETANLLAPLYVVIAAGAIAAALDASRDPEPDRPRGSGASWWLLVLLAVAVALYGIQAAYSTDIDQATETAGFFLVPFALMLRLLIDARWTPRLLGLSLAVVAVEAVVLSLVAFGQLAAGRLFWNDEIITANEFQRYFRVNSLFWDPNIFGRYLALVIVALTACMLWARARGATLLLWGTSAVLFAALVLTYSQSSLAALLAGLVVLAALRWSLRWTAIVTGAAACLALVYVVAFGSEIKFNLGSERALDKTTSGRADLVAGGIELAARRPVWGFGSGSFVQSFREESERHGSVAASHTEPVTVAAEQGVLGFGVYLALLAVSLTVLFGGLRGLVPGLPGRSRAGPGAVGAVVPRAHLIGRVAVAAMFVAMVVHSMSYAAFLSDPLTWSLLALGIVLARRPGPVGSAVPSPVVPEAPAPTPA